VIRDCDCGERLSGGRHRIGRLSLVGGFLAMLIGYIALAETNERLAGHVHYVPDHFTVRRGQLSSSSLTRPNGLNMRLTYSLVAMGAR